MFLLLLLLLLLPNNTFRVFFYGKISCLFRKLSDQSSEEFLVISCNDTLHLLKQYNLVISSDGTDEFSEWQVCLSVSPLLTSCLHFAVKLVMCPLWLG